MLKVDGSRLKHVIHEYNFFLNQGGGGSTPLQDSGLQPPLPPQLWRPALDQTHYSEVFSPSFLRGNMYNHHFYAGADWTCRPFRRWAPSWLKHAFLWAYMLWNIFEFLLKRATICNLEPQRCVYCTFLLALFYVVLWSASDLQLNIDLRGAPFPKLA